MAAMMSAVGLKHACGVGLAACALDTAVPASDPDQCYFMHCWNMLLKACFSMFSMVFPPVFVCFVVTSFVKPQCACCLCRPHHDDAMHSTMM